jgi:hypothetical protein
VAVNHLDVGSNPAWRVFIKFNYKFFGGNRA